jgi:Uncharacterized alpha/beta hydrolase domain (DUF2235)
LKNERISQVWFPGVHANVGGGYPDDSLAQLPLYWIMNEARIRGLVFKERPDAEPDALLTVLTAGDKDGRQYDPRSGFGSYYRYGPRDLADLCDANLSRRKADAVHIALPKIHESAFARIRSDCNAYAPIGLPATYAVATLDGRITQHKEYEESGGIFENTTESKERFHAQQRVWNLVWLRRWAYFLTVGTSMYLVFFRLFHHVAHENEFVTTLAPVSEFVRLVASFLPEGFGFWADAYATNPTPFLVAVVALCFFLWAGAKLRNQIVNSMRFIWKSRTLQVAAQSSFLHTAIYWFRTRALYGTVPRLFKYELLPALGVIPVFFLVWLIVTPVTHLTVGVLDPFGLFCHVTDRTEPLHLAVGEQSLPITFHTDDPCAATGIRVETGERYGVKVVVEKPWADGSIQTTPMGGHGSHAAALAAVGDAFGRTPSENLFQTLVRTRRESRCSGLRRGILGCLWSGECLLWRNWSSSPQRRALSLCK